MSSLALAHPEILHILKVSFSSNITPNEQNILPITKFQNFFWKSL